MRRRAAIAIGLALFVGVGVARADPSPEAAASAREQFKAGLEAVDASDWERAREAFQRSYDAWPRPLTLLNLAGAQAKAGKLVASSASYRSFLRISHGPAAAQAPAAEEALADVERRTPRVVIRTATPLVAADTLLVDGAPVAIAEVGLPLPVDPGDHTASVTRQGKLVASASFATREAETKDVLLDVPLRVAPPAPPPAAAAAPEWSRAGAASPQSTGGLLASPWFWGATVLVIGGAATALVFVTGS